MVGEELIISPILIMGFIFLMVWSLILKGIALYQSAGRKQLGWFIPLLIFNTAGILPIIYLIIYRNEK